MNVCKMIHSFDVLGLKISIKVDSNSIFYRYIGHYDIYVIED